MTPYSVRFSRLGGRRDKFTPRRKSGPVAPRLTGMAQDNGQGAFGQRNGAGPVAPRLTGLAQDSGQGAFSPRNGAGPISPRLTGLSQGNGQGAFGERTEANALAPRLSGLRAPETRGDEFAAPPTATSLVERIQSVAPPLLTSKIAEFGEWLPDLAEYANPGSIAATNVIPHYTSYLPFADLTTASQNATTARALGAISAQTATGGVFVYAGDTTKLYEMVDGTFTDESGAVYATGSDDVWEFAVFNNKVMGTNYTDAVQSIDVGGGGAGAFADMMTSTLKPKARHIDVVRSFVVLGGTNDTTDGEVPNRVWWSAINDQTDFDPAAATQCDYEDLEGGGRVQRVVGGEYGVILQEKQIVRMTYIGTPQIFRFDVVDRKRGTPLPESVISYGRNVFYISDEGFQGFDGTTSTPIGSGKVDRTFWAQFDITNKRGVSAAIDPQNKLACWVFPGAGAAAELPNKMYMFHWPSGRWSEADVDTELLLRTETQGYTLDGLDAVFGADIDDAGAYPLSFDSDFYKGGGVQFAAFNQSHELAFFNGDNLAATIDSSETQLNPPGWTMVTEAYPLVDADQVTVQLGGRARLGNAVSFDSAASLNSAGYCSVRNNSRFHRARVKIAAGDTWSHAQGVEFVGAQTGRR